MQRRNLVTVVRMGWGHQKSNGGEAARSPHAIFPDSPEVQRGRSPLLCRGVARRAIFENKGFKKLEM